ncbi:MAG TPA: F0F1 ATP synthase subunit delta [Candidatus Saccharimonadia bacterium]|nr:F0F1 ATP synthase subunit delta [Candidatus Saccharimonadia bacterium]
MNLPRQKLAVLISDETIKNGISKNLSQNIAYILLKSKKTHQLNSLLRDVWKDWLMSSYLEVIVTSAFPISDPVRNDIKRIAKEHYPEANQVILIETINSSLVGGVRVEFPDQQFDMSVVAKISQLKQLANSRKDQP